jgi:hypothetical protein
VAAGERPGCAGLRRLGDRDDNAFPASHVDHGIPVSVCLIAASLLA